MTDDADFITRRGVVIPASALSWSFSHSGGAGGQHLNKTSTKATLVLDVTAVRARPDVLARILGMCGDTVTVMSQSSRSQWRNRQTCLRQLADLLDSAAAPPPAARRRTKPTRASVERRLEGKRRTSEKKSSRRSFE